MKGCWLCAEAAPPRQTCRVFSCLIRPWHGAAATDTWASVLCPLRLSAAVLMTPLPCPTSAPNRSSVFLPCAAPGRCRRCRHGLWRGWPGRFCCPQALRLPGHWSRARLLAPCWPCDAKAHGGAASSALAFRFRPLCWARRRHGRLGPGCCCCCRCCCCTHCVPGATRRSSPHRPERWQACKAWWATRRRCWMQAAAWATVCVPCTGCGRKRVCRAWSGAPCWPGWHVRPARGPAWRVATCGRRAGLGMTWSMFFSALKAWRACGPRPLPNCPRALGW